MSSDSKLSHFSFYQTIFKQINIITLQPVGYKRTENLNCEGCTSVVVLMDAGEL